ncbi:GNAT family N-acetyltransferase [Streptomyces corynorhini]|uniref:GNAT family N-acetyltransferase n=1 Tax=Streptomyces corynorhini TaxID=2282652 RepID=A0A370AXX2_9ACTN|nr:GNAT family N-acetyltransferase [Streptomyces corynorhini]RDG34487.1 GNAT family N-acetyltransferase [Streptomyces corynorhini]
MAVPQIRPASRADDDALNALDRAAWSPLHAVTPRPAPPYGPFFDALHPVEEFLVAELAAGGREDATAGYIRVARPTPLASNAHVRQIQGLAVHEWARGRGVARALLRAGALHARNQGARRLTLRVLGHNAPARELYASEGFVVEGVLPGEFLLDGAYVDDVFMALPLT